jgi:hypothetical protein
MSANNNGYVFTDKLPEGLMVKFKDLIHVGLCGEDVSWKNFRNERTPYSLLAEENKISSVYNEILDRHPEQEDIVSYLYDSFMNHINAVEERAFREGYKAAESKKEHPAATGHSNHGGLDNLPLCK